MPEHLGAPALPAVPVLRPGLLVVRRDNEHLQVGIDAPHRVVAPDEPDVRRVLDDLASSRRPCPATTAGHRLVRELLDRGLIVDADLLSRGPGAAAALAQAGPEGAGHLEARARAGVYVMADAMVRAGATDLLEASGCRCVSDLDDATLALAIGVGEVARDRFDDLVRVGLPHLLVSGHQAGFTLGPFVEPGLTACVRCVDAHRAETDPRRSVVVEQAARAAAVAGSRVGQSCDPALLALACAWAVRDVVSFIDGVQPSSWSSTIVLTPDLAVSRRRWTRHPLCGCAWDEILAVG